MNPNPMFAKFDQVLGKTTPTPTNGQPAVTSRADQIRALGKQNTPKEAPIVSAYKGFSSGINDVINKTGEAYKGVGDKIVSAYEEGQKKINERPNFLGNKENTGMFGAALESGLGMATGATNALFAPIQGAITSASDAISNNPDIQKLMSSPIGNKVGEAINGLTKPLSDLSAKHPEATRNITDAITLFMNLAGLKGTPKLDIGKGLTSGIETVKTGVENFGNKIPTPEEVGTTIKTKVGDVVGGAKDKITGNINGKTPEQILATPESEVYKLSKPERDFYKQNQTDTLSSKYKEEQANITKKQTDIETQANKELDAKTQASTKQIEDLSAEVDKTAQNKTMELKPKAIKAFGEQSKTYRAIHEEEIAPYKDVPITKEEFATKMDATFPDNPEISQKIQGKVKFDENGQTTVGELDKQIKEIKQKVGKPAQKGNRVYTPEELQTDKALQGMNEILKEKGVDLSKSNKFWREWAPLRDKIITKLKPFDTAGYETKTFSKILKDSGKGDIYNENFIKGIEDVLGKPITKETKTAMQKLTDAQKQQLADKVDAEMKIEDAKLAKEQAIKESKAKQAGETNQLDVKQFELERLARRKALIKNTIKIIIAGSVYGEARKILPILP